MTKRICDYCNLAIRPGACTVQNEGNDFHEHCWEWMQKQKRLHARKFATGATFEVLTGGGGHDERDQK